MEFICYYMCIECKLNRVFSQATLDLDFKFFNIFLSNEQQKNLVHLQTTLSWNFRNNMHSIMTLIVW